MSLEPAAAFLSGDPHATVTSQQYLVLSGSAERTAAYSSEEGCARAPCPRSGVWAVHAPDF